MCIALLLIYVVTTWLFLSLFYCQNCFLLVGMVTSCSLLLLGAVHMQARLGWIGCILNKS